MGAMAQKKILLVEDDALIAMEMEERLIDLGYVVLGPAATLEAAEQVLGGHLPDAALLDANLRGQSSVALGAALFDRGVKVAFCTGYEEVKGLPAHMAGVPVLTKPITEEYLARALKALLGE
jgi:CheY-like chemotaxis protein